MNTKTKDAAAKRARATDTPVDPRQGTAETKKRERATDSDKKVTVLIPAPYKLNLGDGGGIVSYDSGTQEMPLSHALHPYSKDNGVEIYKG